MFSLPSPMSLPPFLRFLRFPVLFLCFASILAGCGNVRGPDAAEEEFTFTAEDVVRFRELAQRARSGDSGTGVLGVPYLEPLDAVSADDDGAVHFSLNDAYENMRADTAVEAGVYRVTNEFLNVRAEPRVTAPIVKRLVQGDAVTLLEFTDAAWAHVKLADGKEGYVAQRYIARLTTDAKLSEEKKAFEGLSFVDFGFVNVRRSPDQQSEKLGELAGQAIVRPISMDAVWARVPFDGREGYVARQYLSPFLPNFLVRQDAYTLPILHYSLADPGALAIVLSHAEALRGQGVTFLSFRDFYDILLRQEKRDVRLPPRGVLVALSGVTGENAREISDALSSIGVRATLFLSTKHVGLAGVTEKMLLTLLANGFDVQSGGHTGEDLRSLTDSQLDAELLQSRRLLEDLTKKTVFAILYPSGGVNERVMQHAAKAGYLLGVGSVPERAFTRSQFLRLPSYGVGKGMATEDVLRMVKGG